MLPAISLWWLCMSCSAVQLLDTRTGGPGHLSYVALCLWIMAGFFRRFLRNWRGGAYDEPRVWRAFHVILSFQRPPGFYGNIRVYDVVDEFFYPLIFTAYAAKTYLWPSLSLRADTLSTTPPCRRGVLPAFLQLCWPHIPTLHHFWPTAGGIKGR